MSEDLLEAALAENKALKKENKTFVKELDKLKELQGESFGDRCIKHGRANCSQAICKGANK